MIHFCGIYLKEIRFFYILQSIPNKERKLLLISESRQIQKVN